MTKYGVEEVKEAIAKAREELDKLEAQVETRASMRAAEDCTCDNPSCGGGPIVSDLSYAAAVAGSFAGGVSA